MSSFHQWVFLVATLMVISGCSKPPEPQLVEDLTSGLWHAEVGEDDYIFEITFDGHNFGGRVHLLTDSRQINEIPIRRVTILGNNIGIRAGSFPPYSGEFDLERDHIVGGVPGDPALRELNLSRVEHGLWQAIHLRPASETVQSSYIWKHPEETEDGWATASPIEVGVELSALEATVQAVLEGRAGALHSLLVTRDSKLILEEYFHGWQREDLHPILSCTKSVASLLVGIAIDQGHLASPDLPVIDFFPSLVGQAGNGWDAVRIRHLLTMTMGIEWARHEVGSRHPPGVDRYADILGRSISSPPGSRFEYVGRGVDLLSGILLDSTAIEVDSFAAENLFSPLRIHEWDWQDDRWQGHPDMSHGLKLRPRDMAKLGQLVLGQGSWQGRRLVSPEWIQESTSTHIPETPHQVQYGYLWWRVDPPPPEVDLGSISFANGIGSHFIAVVPEANMVLVATGGNPFNGRQFDIVRIARDRLLPGVL